jgi:hypothetical protein
MLSYNSFLKKVRDYNQGNVRKINSQHQSQKCSSGELMLYKGELMLYKEMLVAGCFSKEVSSLSLMFEPSPRDIANFVNKCILYK